MFVITKSTQTDLNEMLPTGNVQSTSEFTQCIAINARIFNISLILTFVLFA